MAVTEATLRLQAELDAQIHRVTDEQTRALTQAWVLAWAEVSGDLRDTLTELLTAQDGGRVTRSTMLRSIRLRAVLGQIADRLETLTTTSGVVITSDLRKVVRDAGVAQREILSSQLPGLVDPRDLLVNVRVTDRAFDAIVRRSAEQITSRLRSLAPASSAAVRRELIRGVAVGSNPRRTAARMVERANGKFDGGLTRALVISRTETLDAHRAAAEHAQNEQAGVLTGWVWLCHLSLRTCPSCLVKNGTLHPLEEAGPEDHPQGRCSRMPKTKSWADLGFEVEEPDDLVPDARAWFDGLSEAEQIQLLGRRRWELLTTGQVQWEDLTTLRPADGWRDSWVMTPVAQLRGQAGGRSRVGRAAS